jgi:phosphate starvation-inducible PhoH-like protein
VKQKSRKRVLSLSGVDALNFLGVGDRNLELVEEHFEQDIVVRGDEIIITGESKRIDELTSVLQTLISIAAGGRAVTEGDVMTVLRGGEESSKKIGSLDDTVVYYSTSRRKSIVPRSVRQKEYVTGVQGYDIVFAIGPAGTGKTYLAVAMALAALKSGEIEKIFLSRPVVEAGENLGFLPGGLQEKIDPYIRPIFDALHDMIGREKTQRMIDTGVLEIAPLAYMRGRTLNDAFAVLDEAQNSTIGQMKMFLTRLGVNSKAIVTGDVTQIDLVDPAKSGLVAVSDILDGVEGIKFVWFGEEDVVRHRLVKKIIKAFSRIKPAVGPGSGGKGEPEASDE